MHSSFLLDCGGWWRVGLDFQFQTPGAEVEKVGVYLDSPCRSVAEQAVVLNADLTGPRPEWQEPPGVALLPLTCWHESVLFGRKLDFLARCQAHFLRDVY